MNKRILNIIFILIIGMVGGIFSSQVLLPRFLGVGIFDSNYLARITSGPVYLTEKRDITVQENTALQESIKKVEESIIGVKSVVSSGASIYGSGLILTEDGIMVTLSDIVPREAEHAFYVNGQARAYQILKRDVNNNLVLIKLEGNNLKPCGFADYSNLQTGERVFLLGKIFLAKSIETLANEGIVKYSTEDFIRTNIEEKTTLAGSSLFNIKGELLGLNTIDTEGRVTAIPVSVIRGFAGF